MYKKLIDLAMMSAAQTCVIPLQDWLGLDNSARMNLPGTVKTNWRWRMLPGQLTGALGKEVLKVTKRFGRANWDALDRMKLAKKKVKNEKGQEPSK